MSISFYSGVNVPGTTTSDALDEVLVEWAASLGTTHPTTTGSFSGTASNSWYSLGPVQLSGTSYTYGDGVDYQVTVNGDLYYYFNSTVTGAPTTTTDEHFIFGDVTSIDFYTDSDNDGAADDLWLTITFGSGDLTATINEGASGDVNEVVAGLLSGDTSGLVTFLEDYGIDTTASIASLVANSPFSEEVLLLAA